MIGKQILLAAQEEMMQINALRKNSHQKVTNAANQKY